MKEAAVQRRHNLYRDSMVLTNSDLNLHLLGENTIDWAGHLEGVKGERQGGEVANRKRKQIVSMIQLDGMPFLYESCQEVPGVDGIPEENEGQVGQDLGTEKSLSPVEHVPIEKEPSSPDTINQIRDLINPVLEFVKPGEKDDSQLTNGMFPLEEGDEVKHITSVMETVPRESPKKVDRELDASSEQTLEEQQCESAIESAIHQIEIAIQEDPGDHLSEGAIDSDGEFAQTSTNSSPHRHDDSGFQSPANENVEEVEPQPITDDEVVDTEMVMLTLVEGVKTCIDLDGKASEKKPEVETTADKGLL